MNIARRDFLSAISAIAITELSPSASAQGVAGMYGIIVKVTAIKGKRDLFISTLLEGTSEMPGCLTYIIAKDAADEDSLWITEVWDNKASHDASLSLPAVKAAVAKGRPLIAAFGTPAITIPVGGQGLPKR